MDRRVSLLALCAVVGCAGGSGAPVCISGVDACRPAIVEISPTTVALNSGAEITIRGGPFGADSTVKIGGQPARVVAVEAETIRVDAPCGDPSPKGHDLIVADAQHATLAPGAIHFASPPPWDQPHCSEQCPCDADAGVPDAGAISSIATLPFARADSTVVTDGRYLYALGGEHSPKVTNTTQILRIDPLSSTVEVRPEVLPGPREAAPGVWTGQYVFAFGGRSTQSDLIDSIVRYEPATGEVVTMNARLPTPRYNMGAVWTGQYVYLAGGFDYSYTRQILRYDPASDQLTVEPTTLPHGIEAPAAIWFDQKLYLVGGRQESGACGDIVVYDPTTHAVTSVGTLPLGVWSVPHFFDGDRVYLLGGGDDLGGTRDTIETYRPSTGETSVLPLRLAAPIGGTEAVWLGGAGYVVGGYNPENLADPYFDTVLRFTP